MSASNEQLGDEARQRTLEEIIKEEEQRLGEFVLPKVVESPTLAAEMNWNDVRWGSDKINEPRI